MTGYLIFIALCVLGANAKPAAPSTPSKGRIGGGIAPELAPHACMILVHRTNLGGTNTAALGGGSIISSRHVLTAAHLVQGDVAKYQIGFMPTSNTRRMLDATFRLIHENYDNTDFSNDIALIFLQGTATFPLANAIPISTDEAAPTGILTTVGFGFTAANSTGASTDPYASIQNPATECDLGDIVAAETHFCAIDNTGPTVVCPGDNGAGCFIPGPTVADQRLVGIASRILPGCATPQQTGYTIVGLYVAWITNVTGIPVPTFIENYLKSQKTRM